MKKFSKQILILAWIILVSPLGSYAQNMSEKAIEKARTHHEVPDNPYRPPSANQLRSPAHTERSSGYFTKQVNVDANGQNIVGDAANEPSIAVDPKNPNHIVIGWRQFDNVTSNFRQAGYGYSSDGGQHWTFPGVIDPGVFRSDPVLDVDTSGVFYYNSLTANANLYTCKVYKSTNGGATWDQGTDAHGGDKQWMVIDRSGHQGTGNIYAYWTQYYSSCQPGFLTRSTNAGASYDDCQWVDNDPFWGTLTVGPEGELYVCGAWSSDGILVAKSTNAQVVGSAIVWDINNYANMDGNLVSQSPINPVGIMGQANVDVDRSNGPGRGNVYVLAAVKRISNTDPGDVMFARSTDGFLTFDPPVRINSDVSTTNYQWLATMSVAPNGRIDVAWLDTRDAPAGSFLSALYYSYSVDQGVTWSANEKLSDLFDPSVGYPQQSKMGDYFDMMSDNTGAHLAWSNTLNGEEDVYYTHIIPNIVGINGDPGLQKMALSCSPNPFSDHTTVSYTVNEENVVKVVLCNIYGSEIRTLVDRKEAAGNYRVNFSDRDLPAGFYLCRISAGSHVETTRLVKLNSN